MLPVPTHGGPGRALRPGTAVTAEQPAPGAPALGRTYVVLALLHVPLAAAMASSPTVATLHALVVAGAAAVAILGAARPATVAMTAAYIAGADVLWRMTDARVLHQFSKYAIVVLFGIWMLRHARLRLASGPVLYFLLLVPSVVLVVAVGGRHGQIQRPISFNLSGPLALAVAVLFFRQVRLRRDEILGIMLALALPAFAILSIAARATVTANSIRFGGSNLITSGGYGPNQVSSILGLAFLVLMFAFALVRTDTLTRLFLGGSAVLMGLQTALTFSRGGLYSAAGALLAAFPFLVQTPRARVRVVAVGLSVALVAGLVVIPWLDEFTAGRFARRIADTRLAGRDQLMKRDLDLWTQNAFLGVGPGMSKLTPTESHRATLAHTEFTRMLAEHGALGALAFAALLGMAYVHITRSRPGVPRGLAVAFGTWTFLYMTHAAMRLAAPSFVFGLCAAFMSMAHEEEEPAASVVQPQPLIHGGAVATS